MSNLSEIKEEFEKIFNKIFMVNVKYRGYTTEQWNEEVAPLFRKLWNFISSALKEARQEERKLLSKRILKRLPKEKKYVDGSKGWELNHVWNLALSEVKTILKSELK